MCHFFSFNDNGKIGTDGHCYWFFNWEMRQELLKNNPDALNPDSHASIATLAGISEDKMDKYEYNPLTGVFKIDRINRGKRARPERAEAWVKSLDFKTICEPLIIKPIVHPFRDRTPPKKITKKHIELVRKWAPVWASVRGSVWASVRASMRASVGGSVWASVWCSVGAPMRDSVGGSVWAYASSFFNIPRSAWQHTEHIKYKGNNPFQPAVDLWEMGLVPSFDGTKWRLRGGKNGGVMWEADTWPKTKIDRLFRNVIGGEK